MTNANSVPRRLERATLILLAAFAFTSDSANSALGGDSNVRRTNVVVVLCDDLGYGDVKCLNPEGKIATPRLDRLASEGMIFTDAHSGSAVCSPTRYGLLTGRYAWRSRLKSGVLGGLSPRLIESGRPTIASLLQAKGYSTLCIGKWHLGMNWEVLPGKSITELGIEPPEQVDNVDYSKPATHGPNSVGFDDYFGISGSLDMVPYAFIENDRCTALPTVRKSFPMMLGSEKPVTRIGPAAPDFEGEQVLPTLTRKAIAQVERRASQFKKEGTPFFLYLPLASPHTPILPTKEFLGKSGINPYADFVMQTDAAIGEVIEAIDRQGIREETLVIVTSDNGCSPLARFDELKSKGHDPSARFRGHKADIYEGGHHVPFLVRWPGKVAPGSRCDATIWLGDIPATVAAVANIPIPGTAMEDSESFLPLLKGMPQNSERRGIVHHSVNGTFAIRSKQWKLIFAPGSGGWSAPRPGRDDASRLPGVQLYDLEKDPGETTNRESEKPELVASLTELMQQYVDNGRSTSGPKQDNTTPVDFRKAGLEASRPLKAK